MRRPLKKERIINGYVHIYTIDGFKPRALLVAEKALGKPIKRPAMIHHVNENKLDDDPQNLVVCQDKAYHNTIHKRTRAYKATGYVYWRKCSICKTWGPPKMFVSTLTIHLKCNNDANRIKRKKYAPINNR